MITAEDLVSVFAHHVNPKIGWLRSADAKGSDTTGISEQLQKSFYDAAEEFLTKHPRLNYPRSITSAEQLDALLPGSVVVDESGYAWTKMMHGRWDCAFTSGGRDSERMVELYPELTLIHEVAGR